MRAQLAIVLTATALFVAACGSKAPEVSDGTYRLLTTSTKATTPAATLVVSGPTVTITSDGTELLKGDTSPSGQTLVLCPPDRKGEPLALPGTVSVAGTEYTKPAVYGDCGGSTPVRVTLVDLAALKEGSLPPFGEWAEFCDVTSSDCP